MGTFIHNMIREYIELIKFMIRDYIELIKFMICHPIKFIQFLLRSIGIIFRFIYKLLFNTSFRKSVARFLYCITHSVDSDSKHEDFLTDTIDISTTDKVYIKEILVGEDFDRKCNGIAVSLNVGYIRGYVKFKLILSNGKEIVVDYKPTKTYLEDNIKEFDNYIKFLSELLRDNKVWGYYIDYYRHTVYFSTYKDMEFNLAGMLECKLIHCRDLDKDYKSHTCYGVGNGVIDVDSGFDLYFNYNLINVLFKNNNSLRSLFYSDEERKELDSCSSLSKNDDKLEYTILANSNEELGLLSSRYVINVKDEYKDNFRKLVGKYVLFY